MATQRATEKCRASAGGCRAWTAQASNQGAFAWLQSPRKHLEREDEKVNSRMTPNAGTSRILLLAIALCPPVRDASQAAQPSFLKVPLLDDTRFERGFTVWSPSPGKHVREGAIRPGNNGAEPIWGLAQWHSRHTLAATEPQQLPGGAVRFFDGAKSVTFFPPGSEADIAFGLRGTVEYEGKAPATGDPWPHLLAERALAAHPPITELEALPFSVQYRLVQEEVSRPQGFASQRHTAQFVFYITVQNRNQDSPGYGDYYWFGVTMYDTRYRVPEAHMAADAGSDRKPATGKFIFNPAGDRYTAQSAHDRQWVTIDRDLLPLVREGLETAWQRGYLKDSRDPADYRLGGMNTGWEVTGPIDVEMQLRSLRLDAVPKLSQ